MKRFLLAVCLPLFSLSASAQDWPWNPDIDNDGFISTTDLLAILTVFSTEFQAQMLYTDTSSAVMWIGEEDYWNCASNCALLEGNWKILDEKLVGGYKTELNGWLGENAAWLDARVFGIQWDLGNGQLQAPRLNGGAWTVQVSGFAELAECICQTRVKPTIAAPGIDCAYIDLCGVCEGPGPIYECGCEELPDYFCDCQGNQLDALGVCGGGCLADYDGDGICDEYVNGACGDMDFVSYHGYDYEIVEIGDRCWFAENLRTPYYRNGDSIPFLGVSNSDIQMWEVLGNNFSGARGVHPSYDYDGDVYNWYVVNDERGICPTGWTVPTIGEFEALLDTVVGQLGLSGTAPYRSLVTEALFDTEVTPLGTNESGFSATYSSYRHSNGGWILGADNFYAWSSSYSLNPEAWAFSLHHNDIGYYAGTATPSLASDHFIFDQNRAYGHPIRCIREN